MALADIQSVGAKQLNCLLKTEQRNQQIQLNECDEKRQRKGQTDEKKSIINFLPYLLHCYEHSALIHVFYTSGNSTQPTISTNGSFHCALAALCVCMNGVMHSAIQTYTCAHSVCVNPFLHFAQEAPERRRSSAPKDLSLLPSCGAVHI